MHGREMHSSGRRVAQCLAVLGLLLTLAFSGASRSHAEDEAPPRPSAAPVAGKAWKKLLGAVPLVLWEPERKTRKQKRALAAWADSGQGAVRLSKKQFASLGVILRAGNPFTTTKKRSLTLDVPTGETLANGTEESMPVRIAVSSKYKPGCGRAFPLIITCHGGPQSMLAMATTGSNTQFGVWGGYSSTIDCIVAAPALTGGKYGAREWTFFSNLIRMLDERYSVDRDRILLTGHSWGGIMTWHMGPAHADTFAALAPFICAVNPGREHLANCRALPIYQVQGKKDMKWMVDSGRERRKLLDALGYENVYRELPGGHDLFPGEARAITKWFMQHSRQLYAREIVRSRARGGANTSDLWYWIRTESRDFKARYDPKARRIDVDTGGPFEVFLADDMFDLDEPFVIFQAGEEVWEGTVERRLDFAVAHVRETGDHGRVFAASVKIP